MKEQKYQDQANHYYKNNNTVDIAAVVMGWDLKIGSELEIPGKKIEIVQMNRSANSASVKINGVAGDTKIDTICKLILSGKAIVK